jgi:hypothetical protein
VSPLEIKTQVKISAGSVAGKDLIPAFKGLMACSIVNYKFNVHSISTD